MAGVIAIIPKLAFFDIAGNPAVGYKLYTYLSGSLTPSTTWQDQAMGSANTNPVILDARGECLLWLDSTKEYKFILKTSADVTVWTVDDISGAPSALGVATLDGSGKVVQTANLADLATLATLATNATTAAACSGNSATATTASQLGGVAAANFVQFATAAPIVRQTVLSGPVDSSGFSAFVGSTGSTTVTATGTLKATAAAGGDANYTGSITNPSWTSLSTNGTMYLFFDVTSAGVVTTGSTTLAPVYQWGGTYSTTNLQNTYNIQEATMKVGNGSAATQVYRVFVGEVTVAGAVVTAITWYQLMGRYRNEQVTLAVSTAYSFNHNIGTGDIDAAYYAECKTTEFGYAVGDRIYQIGSDGNASTFKGALFWTTAKTCGFTLGSGSLQNAPNKTTGAVQDLTVANWKIGFIVKRAW